jgi:para-aminobenzoate synthetase component 1
MSPDFNFALVLGPSGSHFLCLDVESELVSHEHVDWTALDEFVEQNRGKFIATLLAYDLKNDIEKLDSNNPKLMDAPKLIYFVPKSVYKIQGVDFEWVYGVNHDDLVKAILGPVDEQPASFELHPSISREQYIQHVESAKNEIQFGNCYELNFCQNFEASGVQIDDAWRVFKYLQQSSQAPFSSFFKWGNFVMMGASPERFIQRLGHKLISQPIKGTRPRKANPEEDEAMKRELLNNTKERAENVMIVDLVRNDLTRVAKTGSIHVDELFGIYSFHAVHQMISTISCELRENIKHADIIKALFPMGSMTGAPKISAMQIIERLENFQRGWYSGSVGLIEPNGDFDMNVVIRTLLYDAENQYLCCPVGSAITIMSEPELEYEECLMKINRILSLFA